MLQRLFRFKGGVVFLFGLLFAFAVLSGCGKRTAPKPYPPLPKLNPTQVTKLYYKGSDLILSWGEPALPRKPRKKTESTRTDYADRIVEYTIYLQLPDPKCVQCDPLIPGRITVATDRMTAKIYDREGKIIFDSRILWVDFADGEYTIELPADILPKGKEEGLYSIAIDYRADNDQSAPLSEPRRPNKPKVFPKIDFTARNVVFIDYADSMDRYHLLDRVLKGAPLDKADRRSATFPTIFRPPDTPKIRNRIVTRSAVNPFATACFPPSRRHFLLIKWTPPPEVVRYTLLESGHALQKQIRYGVKFIDFADFPLSDILYDGTFAFSRSRKTVFARIVDRFGNQSIRLPIFNESDPGTAPSTQEFDGTNR